MSGPVFDAQAQGAIDLAKRSTAEGAELDAGALLASLYHQSGLKDRLPSLAAYLPPPVPLRDDVAPRAVAASLGPVFLSFGSTPVTCERLFAAIVASDAGREHLMRVGASQELVDDALRTLGDSGTPVPSWRTSVERRQAIKDLSAFGRVLTDIDLRDRGITGIDDKLTSLCAVLLMRRGNSALVVGPPGTGKTALVYEFARRLKEGDPRIPAQLRDRDVFELSPTFLKAGASMVGQYEERLKGILDILHRNPKVILFVDEAHSLLQSGMHERGPFSDANEEFKKAVGSGDVVMIGCTTSAEYRYYIEADPALKERFGLVRIEPPSAAQTKEIMRTRLPKVAAHYAPLRIPEALVDTCVDLTEDYLLGREQPRKSIRLLDAACAWCLVQDPPLPELTETALETVLEDTIGHGVVRRRELTEDSLLARLKEHIIGQDEVMAELAHDFVAGLGEWQATKGPRGAFFFAGPTGVGKTYAALILAEILGGDREALLRVDCNTLQGSGIDSGPALNRLLGPPPGYIGYVRGQGGLLSKIRDIPEAIVLFDEIEKADPGVAKILLQILEEGTVHDADDNLLDFRRSFLIFTSNAGVTTSHLVPGFHGKATQQAHETLSHEAEKQSVLDDLQARGFPPEFLGRYIKWFYFQPLAATYIPVIVEQQLASLRDLAELRGYEFEWDPALVDHLSKEWEPRFGVRHVTMIVANRVTEQLSVGAAQGELVDVRRIRLALGTDGGVGGATRRREGDTLVIELG